MCARTLIVRFRLSSATMRTSDSALSHNIKNVSMAIPRNFGNSGMFLKCKTFRYSPKPKTVRQRRDNVSGGSKWDVEDGRGLECLEKKSQWYRAKGLNEYSRGCWAPRSVENKHIWFMLE